MERERERERRRVVGRVLRQLKSREEGKGEGRLRKLSSSFLNLGACGRKAVPAPVGLSLSLSLSLDLGLCTERGGGGGLSAVTHTRLRVLSPLTPAGKAQRTTVRTFFPLSLFKKKPELSPVPMQLATLSSSSSSSFQAWTSSGEEGGERISFSRSQQSSCSFEEGAFEGQKSAHLSPLPFLFPPPLFFFTFFLA